MNAKLALIELNQHECTFYIIGDMIGETEGKKSLKRYFPYKEYTIKAEFGFSLLDKEVYVIFFSICFTAKPEKILLSP